MTYRLPRHTHKLVKNIAQEMCGAFYELAAKDDLFHLQFPSQNRYIEEKWGEFVGQARETLGKMLHPTYHCEEAVKQEIYEALLKDKALQGVDIQAIH